MISTGCELAIALLFLNPEVTISAPLLVLQGVILHVIYRNNNRSGRKL